VTRVVLLGASVLAAGCSLGDEQAPMQNATPWHPHTVDAGAAAVDAGGQGDAGSAVAPGLDAGGGPGPQEASSTSGPDVEVPSLGPAALVAAGHEHSCAVTRAGAAVCWGANGSGQLGNGSNADSAVPVPVSGLGAGVAAISAGADHTCALVAVDGGTSVQCWGRNDHGQLGDGTTTDRSVAVSIVGLPTGATVIAAGALHTCAVAGGSAWCWGDGSDGQLGNGAAQDASTPVAVSGLSGVRTVAAGGAHTCAVTLSGSVSCWGLGSSGQLGVGSTTGSPSPVAIASLGAPAAVVSAGNATTCALTAVGAKCWGYGQFGQLGDGATADSPVPVDVMALPTSAPAVAAGGEHTCALDPGGGVWCWGEDESGQLGDDGAADSPVPVQVLGIASGAGAIAAGTAHTCTVDGAGGVRCWGWNVSGQLGNGTTTDSATAVVVAGF